MNTSILRPRTRAPKQTPRHVETVRGNKRTQLPGHGLQGSDVVAMFATLVWKTQLEDALRDAVNPVIVRTLNAMRRASPLAPGRGWQSSPTLHQRDELRELMACVQHVATGILRFLRIGCDSLEITGCWATILAVDAMHSAHSHPNNFVSGVYYVRTGPGADTINFHDPRRQSGIIRPPVIELTAENTDQVVVRVTDGTLLLFPSYLEHSVDANASGQERISLSFNLMFPAFTETLAKPMW